MVSRDQRCSSCIKGKCDFKVYSGSDKGVCVCVCVIGLYLRVSLQIGHIRIFRDAAEIYETPREVSEGKFTEFSEV